MILPVVALIDSFNQSYAETGIFAKIDMACGLVVTLSTLFGMWCFKCLLPLMTESIQKRAASKSTLDAMEQFLLLQMLFSKVMDKIMPLILKTDLHANNWTMPNTLFLQVVAGFLTCVLQLYLAHLGLRAYEAGPAMYPPVNFATDLPPDTMAVLDMGGIDPDKKPKAVDTSSSEVRAASEHVNVCV